MNDNVNSKKIPLIECFGPTVQGEGAVIGQQTYFLRFGLCDFKCVMCDSMHAVDPQQVKANAQWLTQQEIFDTFEKHRLQLPTMHSTRWVTFSGGNPCIHDLQELTELMNNNDYSISVETQGTFCPEWLWNTDALAVSPKGLGMGEQCDLNVLDAFMRKMIRHPGLYIKIVVFDQRDIEFASMIFERYVIKGLGPLETTLRPSQFFLSLGNPWPPGSPDIPSAFTAALTGKYLSLLEDVQKDPNLCEARFLPQMHVLLWGNRQGV